MDYTITAPVILQFDRVGYEEEPIRAYVTAETREKAVELFQEEAYAILVESGNCAGVDFYPYSEFAEKYEIVEE